MRYEQGVALVLGAGTLWSLMGLGLRQIETATVWQILFWRSVGAVLVLFAFTWWSSGGRPFAQVRRVGLAGAIGGFGLVFAFAGSIYAIQTTTIANAVFLFTASPFVAAILGWILLGERVKPWTWVAIALAVFGMYLMVREGLAIGALAGNIAALLSATGFGAFSVCLRWGKVNDMLPVSMLGGLFAMAVAALVLTAQGQPIVVSTWDMGMATLIGAVILALGMVMYTAGSR
ncbi:MAG: DMT family transporter [Tabrizicola sp.]